MPESLKIREDSGKKRWNLRLGVIPEKKSTESPKIWEDCAKKNPPESPSLEIFWKKKPTRIS